jgi:hypothetical protein
MPLGGVQITENASLSLHTIQKSGLILGHPVHAAGHCQSLFDLATWGRFRVEVKPKDHEQDWNT